MTCFGKRSAATSARRPFSSVSVPLTRSGLTVRAMHKAFHSDSGSGLSLSTVLEGFLGFLQNQCATDEERAAYINEVSATQTGEMVARKETFDRDELDGRNARSLLLPNVRLVNGDSSPVTRRRLMLTFNSPFFPEVLIASSVMALKGWIYSGSAVTSSIMTWIGTPVRSSSARVALTESVPKLSIVANRFTSTCPIWPGRRTRRCIGCGDGPGTLVQRRDG